jgi:hypothetical protein
VREREGERRERGEERGEKREEGEGEGKREGERSKKERTYSIFFGAALGSVPHPAFAAVT